MRYESYGLMDLWMDWGTDGGIFFLEYMNGWIVFYSGSW